MLLDQQPSDILSSSLGLHGGLSTCCVTGQARGEKPQNRKTFCMSSHAYRFNDSSLTVKEDPMIKGDTLVPVRAVTGGKETWRRRAVGDGLMAESDG